MITIFTILNKQLLHFDFILFIFAIGLIFLVAQAPQHWRPLQNSYEYFEPSHFWYLIDTPGDIPILFQ